MKSERAETEQSARSYRKTRYRKFPGPISCDVHCCMRALLQPIIVMLFVVNALLTGCVDADPFGRSTRTISGPYQLELFESGKYYILKRGHERGGGGYIEGTVEEIGWDSQMIAVNRYSTFRGDPDGWMIIDLDSNTLSGPISDSDFNIQYPELKTTGPDTAWKNMKRK